MSNQQLLPPFLSQNKPLCTLVRSVSQRPAIRARATSGRSCQSRCGYPHRNHLALQNITMHVIRGQTKPAKTSNSANGASSRQLAAHTGTGGNAIKKHTARRECRPPLSMLTPCSLYHLAPRPVTFRLHLSTRRAPLSISMRCCSTAWDCNLSRSDRIWASISRAPLSNIDAVLICLPRKGESATCHAHAVHRRTERSRAPLSPSCRALPSRSKAYEKSRHILEASKAVSRARQL